MEPGKGKWGLVGVVSWFIEMLSAYIAIQRTLRSAMILVRITKVPNLGGATLPHNIFGRCNSG